MRFSGSILYVPDVRASLDFYGRAFGFQTRFVTDGGEYGDLALEGGLVLGFASLEQSRANWEGGARETDREAQPPAFEVALETADVPAAYERALKAGASPLKAPQEKPWGQTVAFLRDPDGHVIELATPWAPPAAAGQ